MYVIWNFIFNMNVFDFDGTIYDGDSSIDFWLFCLKNDISLIRFFPLQLTGFFLYKCRVIDKKKFKTLFFKFLCGIKNINNSIVAFWNTNDIKIKKWYKDIHSAGDCIVSASPIFLLNVICKKIGINNLIATSMNKRTGEIIGKNCYGNIKSELFKEKFATVKIENFYSDSKSDLPIALLAKQAYFVKKNKIRVWDFT